MADTTPLETVVANLRIDLKDTVEATYRFSDDELERAVVRAVYELSKYSPRQLIAAAETADGSDEIDILELEGIENLIKVEKVEYPVDNTPRTFVRFTVYGTTITMIDATGDGTDANIYYSASHVIDGEENTVPAYLHDLIILGASAYAALIQSQYATDKANYGGENVDRDFLYWAKGRLMDFEAGLKKLNRKIKSNVMYPE
jgi:hypothetical protein